ncbi:uncharacterized protein BDV17DRAFT_255478 [Aspergillus undulatus]|uniref:uncharacterized protein n=1 Tax=Aspergillus undulatus TaxID=1810928 RepID=UPI003CCD0375
MNHFSISTWTVRDEDIQWKYHRRSFFKVKSTVDAMMCFGGLSQGCYTVSAKSKYAHSLTRSSGNHETYLAQHISDYLCTASARYPNQSIQSWQRIAMVTYDIFEKEWNMDAYNGLSMRTNGFQKCASVVRVNFRIMFCANYLRRNSCKGGALTEKKF